MTCDRVQIIRSGELVYQDTMENLSQQFHGSCAVIGLGQEIEQDKISALPHVASVEILGPRRWRLLFETEQDPIQEIAKQIIDNGWGLTELVPEQKSLEDIFVDITTSEEEQSSTEDAAA